MASSKSFLRRECRLGLQQPPQDGGAESDKEGEVVIQVNIKFKDGTAKKLNHIRYISTVDNELYVLRYIYKNNLERRQKEEVFSMDDVKHFFVDQRPSYRDY